MASQIHPFAPSRSPPTVGLSRAAITIANDWCTGRMPRMPTPRRTSRAAMRAARSGTWHRGPARYAAPGMIMVLAPRPAVAWAKASSMRVSGNRPPTSRFTPSLGRSASARRNAVPRP